MSVFGRIERVRQPSDCLKRVCVRELCESILCLFLSAQEDYDIGRTGRARPRFLNATLDLSFCR